MTSTNTAPQHAPMSAKDKRLLIIVAAVFVILAGGAFTVHHVLNAPARVLGKVVEPMVRDLAASKWSGQALMKYSTPEFRIWMVDNHVATGMPGFSYLGKVTKYVGIQQLAMNDTGDAAAFIADFLFEAGPASITLQMVKRDGKWLIYSFTIDSPVFIKQG